MKEVKFQLPEHFPNQIRNFNVIQVDSIPIPQASTPSKDRLSSGNSFVTRAFNIESSGKQLILSSLEKTEGNIKESADLLGISRRTLYRKIEKYNIKFADYRK